ncbi:alkaline phosphatase PafA [Lentiprolixibacter aurantiacus]|uniref:Alkaline phosphatase family protein n=1 Tax=Lentiprolixibacter aurantiacus TaxID=2993939 RepID=A0AAE3MNW9_9FLAO|nr:alkaline phosphatase PafA [Lentiprolixibacter aurantiacus]MCX2720726.1 alkaline phosphatase family protein [Lentiprolixibacter aurantiacus]
MKRFQQFVLALFFIIFSADNTLYAQKKNKVRNSGDTEQTAPFTRPKLVVGIIVDQMRYDYLTRFWGHYGEGGFKRLVNEGFNCRNNHFNYAPTKTGPGHASVYTGTTPAVHGIIGNDYYDKESGAEVYCASDPDQLPIGTQSEDGKMSPHRMLVSTITDELRLHTQMRSKVIAISLKHRGAVFPGGHTASAAYWFSGESEGKWISSSYYMEELPAWVKQFNASGSVDKYKKVWNTLKPIDTYLESGADNTPYEEAFNGESAPVFPHNLPSLWEANEQYEMIFDSPYGNSLTTDFVFEALDNENLGEDDITDFLAISYSSTDRIGHQFGVNSKEVQDTYLRLDKDLERLFAELDKKVGEGQYTVFLTADHAAVNVPAYLKDAGIPAGNFSFSWHRKKLDDFLSYRYGTSDLIKDYSNAQLFLDYDLIQNLDLSLREVQEEIAAEILKYKGISQVYTGYQMINNDYRAGIPHILQNGYHPTRSGDVLFVLEHGYAFGTSKGSEHGSPQVYDTHTPLLFYGKGIKKGSTAARTETPDIAPTIASLLGIAFPNGTTGSPIEAVLE